MVNNYVNTRKLKLLAEFHRLITSHASIKKKKKRISSSKKKFSRKLIIIVYNWSNNEKTGN